MSRRTKIVNVMGHWEMQDAYGNCLVSGDTRDECLEAYEDMKYEEEDDD